MKHFDRLKIRYIKITPFPGEVFPGRVLIMEFYRKDRDYENIRQYSAL